jgi:hypothetical protein
MSRTHTRADRLRPIQPQVQPDGGDWYDVWWKGASWLVRQPLITDDIRDHKNYSMSWEDPHRGPTLFSTRMHSNSATVVDSATTREGATTRDNATVDTSAP